MIYLKNISKDYYVGNQVIHALKGINLSFQSSEFVAILGPSGCGKTTLLNILGGLDRYTSGDLIINNKSTSHFQDSDWDAYRNRSVGFVFQNYYLIPHLSVQKNVELALTLAGVSKKERKERAKEALKKVGLSDQAHKRPNQLSGGQMQRVSIARALINNPEIILADEPTGALDSKTSRQIVDLLKEISKERLVVMVTHNEQLANEYATRIIRLMDGEILSDTENIGDEAKEIKKGPREKTSMSLLTALTLSGANLWTKKMRTLLTAFAASIGIIGIALVMGISCGLSGYIDQAQLDTLANLPLSISQQITFYDEDMQPNTNQWVPFPDEDKVYPYLRSPNYTHINKISLEFEEYLNQLDPNLYNAITYRRQFYFYLMVQSEEKYRYVSSSTLRFQELLNNDEYMQGEYQVIAGKYPTGYNEIALVVDRYNRIPTTVFAELGLDFLKEYYTFDDLLGLEIKLIPNDVRFVKNADGTYFARNASKAVYEDERNIVLRVTGILRMYPDTATSFLSNGVAYPKALTDEILRVNGESAIVKEQLEYGLTKDVKTGQPFKDETTSTGTITAEYRFQSRLIDIGGQKSASEILIYPKTFESKDQIKLYLDAYNEGREEKILYSDRSETLSKTIGRVVSAVTLVLVAFSGVSLFVSSIMIGIITYISVIERIKEIGLLRSLGARKKDISRVFIAETLLIGFVAGLMGMFLAYIASFPINKIIERETEVANVAQIRPLHAIILIGLSMLLTVIAGFIPSRIAAKKDPVVALRTE